MIQKQTYNDSSDNAIISFLSVKLFVKFSNSMLKFRLLIINHFGLTVIKITGNLINIEEVHYICNNLRDEIVIFYSY